MTDDARSKILARRARFVAAALAGVSTACTSDPKKPVPEAPMVDVTPEAGEVRPQASPVPPPDPPDAAAEPAPPQPCLTVVAPPDAGKPHPVPRPCLKPVPRPCLTPKKP